MVLITTEQAKRFPRIATLPANANQRQVLDSSERHLTDFCFASKTRNFAMGKQRHTVDGFRTVCWFHHLRIASGATTTYQMDVLVEPTRDAASGGPIDRKNKWRSYREGRHTPSAGLVEAVEARFPGGRDVLRHPVWRVLRLDRPMHDGISSLLAELPPRLYSVVSAAGDAERGARFSPCEWDARRLRRLERVVGFDALACLVVLLRIAAEGGDSAGAHKFGRALCRLLLMMGGWLFAHGVAQPLADYVEQWMLPMAAHAGDQNGFGEMGFVTGAKRLAQAANTIAANENTALTSLQRADVMLDLLDDRFNLELSALLASTKTAVVRPSSCSGVR